MATIQIIKDRLYYDLYFKGVRFTEAAGLWGLPPESLDPPVTGVRGALSATLAETVYLCHPGDLGGGKY